MARIMLPNLAWPRPRNEARGRRRDQPGQLFIDHLRKVIRERVILLTY
jgi:hypothetical protein